MLGPYNYHNENLTYQGQYYNGDREGIGEQVWKDGSCFIGNFKSDKSNGKGIQIYGNGDWYNGEWKNGMSHGFGEYFQANENTNYEGEWCEGEQNGFGKETYSDGSVYEGNIGLN